ncbi:MAG: polyribonucleotide nucleotidyltransferase [Sumerlaeia bacterium]
MARKRSSSKKAATAATPEAPETTEAPAAEKPAAKKAARKSSARKPAATQSAAPAAAEAPAEAPAAKKASSRSRKSTGRQAAKPAASPKAGAVTETKGLNFTEYAIEVPYGDGKTLELSTGKLAKQAGGAVMAKVGGTVVLAAVVMSETPNDRDFLPLMVDYREKFYSSGRIPGSFFKRESRPSDMESLRARLTDRTLRPLFPKTLRNEIIVSITVLSMDLENPAEVVAMTAASAALHISNIPFKKPIAGVRVGRVDGQFVLNPTFQQIENCDINLIVSGHADAINMVEAGALEASEADMVTGLEMAHDNIKQVTAGIDSLRAACGKAKVVHTDPEADKDLVKKVEKLFAPALKDIPGIHNKKARGVRFKEGVAAVMEGLGEEYASRKGEVSEICHDLDEAQMRKLVLTKGQRADGRKPDEIRPIWGEVDVLPSVHGSSVFTRGETQALAVTTLGTPEDKQMVDDITGVSHKRFFLHYNFPGFSVGEAKPPRGPGRREIGHGALAERAISAILPPPDQFPYTIRSVVEILESNGSSSMATICSTSMALMDAGVPLARPVAGIAMGSIVSEDGKKTAILSDIQGIEDHSGDMDFKVAGSEKGITALQMDIKIDGVTSDMLAAALKQAREGRLHILGEMAKTINKTRVDMKPQTPRMSIIQVPVERIREVIGSGGKIVRGIQEETGCKIEIEDDGNIYLSAANGEAVAKAIQMVDNILRVPKEGEIITGQVVRTMEHGAIVSLFGNTDGMIHISELEHHRVDTVEDVVNVGDTVTVKVLEIDKERGRIRLSRKALLEKSGGGGGRGPSSRDNDDVLDADPEEPGDDIGNRSDSGGGRGRRSGGGGGRGGRDRGDRGDRGGDRGDRGGDRSDRGDRGGDRGGDRAERGEGGGGRTRRPRPPRRKKD